MAKNKKIGLFFGSFNPIHMGHLMIASYMANQTDFDEVWLVVSPQNPLKKKGSLANQYDRLEMVELALAGTDNIRASQVEFSLPQPSYTIDTLTYLRERHPNHDYYIIMGSDNLHTLHKWKNADVLLRDYKIAVYPRPGYEGHALEKHPSVTLTNTPLIEISSTFIRQMIKDGIQPKFFVPDAVMAFMDKKGLYRT
jgi:nicotinate-nucleotide adenylyltransferase